MRISARTWRALSIIASMQRRGWPERKFWIYGPEYDAPITPWVLSG